MKINNNKIIQIKNITKKFNDFVALNNVSIDINKSEKIALIGANGAGKTTLIEIILKIIKPTSGNILMNFDYKSSPLEKIGVQFQDSTYPNDLTVSEIIEFFIDVSNNKIDQNSLNKMVSAFEIQSFITKNASLLSGGQKQKLSVFLALVSNPEIIFLDELTTGLDIRVSKSITKFIKEYIESNNTTMILVSHNPFEIEKLCNRIIALKDGKIVHDEPIKEINKKYDNLNIFMEKFI